MSERPKDLVLKTSVGKPTVGSNPPSPPHSLNAGVRRHRQAHRAVTPTAVGSSPATPAIYSPVAQLAEHLAVNQRVPGSSPGGGATKLKDYKHNPWDIFMSNKGVKR